MRLGWDAATLSDLREGFRENGLDELARALVRVELHDRAASLRGLEGPAPTGVSDGGREVEVTLTAPAALGEADYLRSFGVTFSILGGATRVAVSCNTGKDIASVRKDAMKDASGVEGGDRTDEVLRGGGRLVLMTTQAFTAAPLPAGARSGRAGTPAMVKAKVRKTEPGKESLVSGLAAAYAARLGAAASALAKQIVVIDGNDLLEYLRLRKPVELGDPLLARLGVEDWPTIRTYTAARADLGADRTLPNYQPDASRRGLTAQIHSFVASEPPAEAALCVVGAPGVGKTRCVLESVRVVESRVLYVVGDVVARRLIEDESVLLSAPGAILVVDDTRVSEARELFQAFRRARSGGSPRTNGPTPRLIMIVPAGTYDPDDLPRVPRVPLLPLDEPCSRNLLAAELAEGSGSERVSKVYRVTEGYPWFSLLVAREVFAGAPIPETTTSAAKLAICPDLVDLTERLRRARALLAAMLSREAAWDDLSDAALDALARAVDLNDRRDLASAIRRCAARGVLRRGAHLYVTPSVLEREVWRILRDDESPDPTKGTQRLMDRIRSHTPELAPALLDRLSGIELSAEELTSTADTLLETLQVEVAVLADLAAGVRSAALRFIARHAPEDAGRWLGRLISATSGEELRARGDLRRLLVSTLDLIARRGAAFEPVEEALFALRLAENEPYVDNASSLWVLLFHPVFDLTHASLARRLEVIARRCLTGDPVARASAVRGLQDLLQRGASVLSRSEGERPGRLDARCQQEARAALCALLLRCAADPDAVVRGAAQGCLLAVARRADDLLPYLPDGPELERAMESLSETTRSTLRHELGLEHRGAARPSPIVARLEALTRPGGYSQRLRDQVGRYVLGGAVNDEAYAREDEALVREGLAPPTRPLLDCLGVLEEPAAERSSSFAVTAGRLDAECALLAPLELRAAEEPGVNTLSAYCYGHHLAGRDELVRSRLAAWLGSRGLAAAILATVGRLGVTEPLLRVALDAIRAHTIPQFALRHLTSKRWLVNDTSLQEAFEIITDRFGDAGMSAVLWQLGMQLRSRADDSLVELAIATTERDPGRISHADLWPFEQCLRWLLDRGRAHEVGAILLRSLAVEGLADRALFELLGDLAARYPEELWSVLRPVLEGRDEGALQVVEHLSLWRVHLHLPAAPVLDWIGESEGRASRVASLIPLDVEGLPPIASALIERFGPHSPPARALASSLHSTPHAVSSLARFYEERRDVVLRWREQGSPTVKEWASKEAASLERRRAWHIADEAAERRRYGT